MVLSGESSETRSRSKKALERFRRHNGKVKVLVSGSHSGLFGKDIPNGMEPDYRPIKNFLLENEVEEDSIVIENESLDTLGNLFFARNRGLITTDHQRVELITDAFHMPRSRKFAKCIYNSQTTFNPIESSGLDKDWKKRLFRFTFEKAQEKLILADLKIHGVKEGDFRSLRKYIFEVQPFYSNNRKASLYGLFILPFKAFPTLQRILPTQVNAYGEN